MAGLLNVRTNYEQYKVPVFNTYEEFHKTVLRSCENISIMLNIDGNIAFISQNVLPLLGHRPEDIVGKTLLNIILNEEKEEISQKVFLKLPLAQSVGKLIEFCCYVRKGKTGHLDAQHTYDYGYMYEEPDTYEYVKFTLYLQDSYDESFIFFGNYGPNSRSIWPSTPNFLHNQQYYLMGTISVLRTKTKSEHPVEIQPAVIVIESDDDSNIENYRLQKRRKNEIQRDCKAKYSKVERPESVTKVKIEDIQPATRKTSFGLVQVGPGSQSSTHTSTSTASIMSKDTSISSTDLPAASFSRTSTFGQVSLIDTKTLLACGDIKLEVAPEIPLNDSQEEQASPEKSKWSDENVKKPLDEGIGSNLKEHVVDEVPGASSDEDDCIIVEAYQVKRGRKNRLPILDQGQGQQKTVQTDPKYPHTVKQPVQPKAEVEAMVHTDLPACVEAEVVAVTNDLGPLPITFFGCDNSEDTQNGTQRFENDHAIHTSILLCLPLTRSHQTTPMPGQSVAVMYQPWALTNQQWAALSYNLSARSQHPSARLH
ncbi:hypothetical protein STEG23_019149, partial [Scotinomys teguina]